MRTRSRVSAGSRPVASRNHGAPLCDPGMPGTSHMHPYLNGGPVSPRQIALLGALATLPACSLPTAPAMPASAAGTVDEALVVYVDGIPVSPGHRGSGCCWGCADSATAGRRE